MALNEYLGEWEVDRVLSGIESLESIAKSLATIADAIAVPAPDGHTDRSGGGDPSCEAAAVTRQFSATNPGEGASTSPAASLSTDEADDMRAGGRWLSWAVVTDGWLTPIPARMTTTPICLPLAVTR